ncbi:hypothetical protein DOE76_12840 [Leifsonia sp. ku-ls]|nr:hypothetical protein DOE76_12840 [Leifsonia sp. ku-ls]
MRRAVWSSVAYAVVLAIVFHLLATLLPVGWTPPLVVGFYLVFSIGWTLPMSALLGLVLGLLLGFALQRFRPRGLSPRTTRMVVAVVFGVLAAAGTFVIFSRLWPSGVALFGALLALVCGVALVALLPPRPPRRPMSGAQLLSRVRELLEGVIGSASPSERDALRDQVARLSRVEGPITTLALTTTSTMRTAYPDGPLLVDAYAVAHGVTVGDAVIRMKDGLLDRLEFVWWGGDPPTEPPTALSIEATGKLFTEDGQER